MCRVQLQLVNTHQNLSYGIIAIAPAAGANIGHIATHKYTLYDEGSLSVIVQRIKVNIPENTLIKDRMFFLHTSNLRISTQSLPYLHPLTIVSCLGIEEQVVHHTHAGHFFAEDLVP